MGTSITGKHLHIDCFAGVAGDMFLGAAIDLGVPVEAIRSELAKLPLSGYELVVERASRGGIEGCDVHVEVQADHDHDDRGDHVPHGRSYRQIREMLREADLAPATANRALDMFERIARAEGRMHGVPAEQVHFHEVGAVDSIVDVVGAAAALRYLDPQAVSCRPVPLGHGTTRCAHGNLPVPAPAAVEILAGCSVEDGGAALELCTPTGAAIVAAAASRFGELPAGTLVATGYGAGDRQLPDRPNMLRLFLLDPAGAAGETASLVVIEANIDNMSPEWAGYLMERLLAHDGVVDVWFAPISMKKNRPAVMLSVLCSAEQRSVVAGLIFAESTTIGLRYHRVARQVLDRRIVEVETRFGAVKVKEALEGQRVVNVAPEFESCRAAARAHDVPLKEVYGEVLRSRTKQTRS